jgi:diaminopimelate decarboxylase
MTTEAKPTAGTLSIDGVDAEGLAAQYGTPLFVFSENKIARNTKGLRNAVESVHPRIKLCYASKANSNMAVLSAIRDAGGDCEVNSGGELFKAKTIGFKPDQIVFNGVSKTDNEIRDAIDYGILAINIDSLPYWAANRAAIVQVRNLARPNGRGIRSRAVRQRLHQPCGHPHTRRLSNT